MFEVVNAGVDKVPQRQVVDTRLATVCTSILEYALGRYADSRRGAELPDGYVRRFDRVGDLSVERERRYVNLLRQGARRRLKVPQGGRACLGEWQIRASTR